MSLLEIGPVIFGSTESPINYLRRHHILADHLVTLILVIELDIAFFWLKVVLTLVERPLRCATSLTSARLGWCLGGPDDFRDLWA